MLVMDLLACGTILLKPRSRLVEPVSRAYDTWADGALGTGNTTRLIRRFVVVTADLVSLTTI